MAMFHSKEVDLLFRNLGAQLEKTVENIETAREFIMSGKFEATPEAKQFLEDLVADTTDWPNVVQ